MISNDIKFTVYRKLLTTANKHEYQELATYYFAD